MKIAMIGPVYPYRGGIAHFTTQLGLELEAHGDTVEVISFFRQYPAWLYPGKTDQDPSSEHSVMPAQFLLDPLNPLTWLRVARKISQNRPDIVLIQWWTTFWGPAYLLLASLLRSKHIPVGFIIHNVLPHEPRFFDKWLTGWVLSCAPMCITLSSKEELRLRKLLPKMPVYTSHLPVHHLSSKRYTKSDACGQLGIPENAFTLLFFGIVRPYKGLALMLQALALIRPKLPEVHLLIAGEFWEPVAEYESMIRALKLQDCVTLNNRYIPNEEVPLYFSSADLLVAPYTGGSQSSVVKLALGFGLPVVVSDLVADDLIRKHSDALVFATGDVEQLGAGILELFARPPLPSNPPGADDSWLDLIQAVEAMVSTLKRGERVKA